jgi:hypothetical protein
MSVQNVTAVALHVKKPVMTAATIIRLLLYIIIIIIIIPFPAAPVGRGVHGIHAMADGNMMMMMMIIIRLPLYTTPAGCSTEPAGIKAWCTKAATIIRLPLYIIITIM